MKLKVLFPLVVAGTFAASAASAQVAASFDNLVDQVLTDTNAAFFSGAVNVADINGSINITAGSASPEGSTSETTGTEVVIDGFEAAGTNILDTGLTNIEGSGSFFDGDETTAVFGAVTQDFGDVASVAAGAINDSTMVISETGATASVQALNTTSNTSVDINANNVAGADIGAVTGALNTGGIDGSVTLAMENASGGASSIGSTAAGAINTSSITATFVGGDNAEADATLP